MKKIEEFKIVQGEDFFLMVCSEVRLFVGRVCDYISIEDVDYINCIFLAHKTDNTLSGLAR